MYRDGDHIIHSKDDKMHGNDDNVMEMHGDKMHRNDDYKMHKDNNEILGIDNEMYKDGDDKMYGNRQ